VLALPNGNISTFAVIELNCQVLGRGFAKAPTVRHSTPYESIVGKSMGTHPDSKLLKDLRKDHQVYDLSVVCAFVNSPAVICPNTVFIPCSIIPAAV
jgi:hypothetical protein